MDSRRKKLIKIDEKEDEPVMVVTYQPEAKEALEKRVAAPKASMYYEIKYFEDFGIAVTPGFNGSFYNLNYIGQGMDWYQRIGREIRCYRLKLRVHCYAPPAGSDIMHFLVVCDTTSVTAPVVGELLDLNAITRVNWAYLNEKNYGRRFRVLKEWRSPFLSEVSHSEEGRPRGFEMDIKIPKSLQVCRYETTALDIPVCNSLYLFASNDNNTTTGSMTWSARCYFADS